MYLIDTNVISEARKRKRANGGVQRFFHDAAVAETAMFLSVVTLGELRRGVGLIRHRGDLQQASVLESWLSHLLNAYRDNILEVDIEVAQLWGSLRVPHPQHGLDKLIAATALIYDVTLVTRNVRDFADTRVRLLNPFTE